MTGAGLVIAVVSGMFVALPDLAGAGLVALALAELLANRLSDLAAAAFQAIERAAAAQIVLIGPVALRAVAV